MIQNSVQNMTDSIRNNVKTKTLLTTRNTETHKWFKLLKSITSNNIDTIVNYFVEQLKQDIDKLNNNKDVSECAIYAPRRNSTLDKKYGLAHKISLKLFMPRLDDQKGHIWSHTQYGKIIPKLSRKYREEEINIAVEKKQTKYLNAIKDKKNFCDIKKKPLAKTVIKPEAMPVEISDLDSLQPFFKFLSNNTEISPNYIETKFYNEPNCMKFEKGAVYVDGRMDLCKQVVGPTWIESLMNSLKTNNKIQHFLLGNNIIDLTGAKAIKEFLLNGGSMITWYLAGNRINSEGIGHICEGLQKDTTMRYLWLKRNPIMTDGAIHLANLLKINNHINILDLHNTGLMDDGIKILCEGLNENQSLRHLYLDANGITELGVKYLADYFNTRKTKGITSLWIDMNRLMDEGVKILLDSLKNYPYIKRLNIGSTGSTSLIGKYLYDTFKNHQKITVLGIGSYKSTNDMGEFCNELGNGVKYVAELLKVNKSIKYLDVSYNSISDDGFVFLVDAIKQNDTLMYLMDTQFNYSKPQEISSEINKKLIQNRKDKIGDLTLDIRYLRHSKKIQLIDSIYRNKM